MARLDIRLLGGFEVRLLGQPVNQFESDSARALLARLALDPGRRFSRSSLAELFWPDRPAGAALGNLRHSLTFVRRAIGDDSTDRPFLQVSPTHIAADAGADVWVDALEVERVVAISGPPPASVEEWQQIAGLYRGKLLDGIELGAGAEWEDWLRTRREAITRRVSEVLRNLAALRERTGEGAEAVRWVRRWLELAPWDERANRQLMRLLATGGEQAAAVAHANWLIERLRTDVGVEPHPDTLALAEQIRVGRFPEPQQRLPAVLFAERTAASTHPAFVDRDPEIDWLDARLDDALTGNGCVAMIAGTAGSGKSMLLHEFAGRAARRRPRLVTVRGSCNAYTGVGDPYLPFRQVLGSLCGDLEHDWASGTLTGRRGVGGVEPRPDGRRRSGRRGSVPVGELPRGRRPPRTCRARPPRLHGCRPAADGMRSHRARRDRSCTPAAAGARAVRPGRAADCRSDTVAAADRRPAVGRHRDDRTDVASHPAVARLDGAARGRVPAGGGRSRRARTRTTSVVAARRHRGRRSERHAAARRQPGVRGRLARHSPEPARPAVPRPAVRDDRRSRTVHRGDGPGHA